MHLFCFLDWSFKKLFGRSIKSACPLASTSRIYVDISSNKVRCEMLAICLSKIGLEVIQQFSQ